MVSRCIKRSYSLWSIPVGPMLAVYSDKFLRVLCRMVRDGYFGFQDYFKSLCDKVEDNDFYLLGSDFGSYLEAQVTHFSLGHNFFPGGISKMVSRLRPLTVIHRLLRIKHLLIKRNGLGWAFLALLVLGDLAVTEQSKSTQTRLGELSHAGALSETQAYPSDDKISLLIKTILSQ